MTFARKSGGANVALTTVKRRSGGAWVDVQNVYRRQSGAWVQVYSAYTPISNVQHADYSRTATGTASSGSVTVPLTDPTWSGGNPGATVSWSIVTGAAVISAGSLETSGAIPTGSNVSGTIKVTVSDGVSSSSKTINYSLSYQQVQ